MGKSAKKSASKDAAVVAPAPTPAKPLKNGKRKAEVVLIEKELATAKKQKVVSGNKSEKKLKKKVESDTESAQKPENKPAPLAKKEGDSKDIAPAAKRDEDEKPAPKKKQKVVKKKVDSDTESAQKPEKKPAPLAKKEGDSEDVAPAAKRDEVEKPAPKKQKHSTGGGGSKTLFVGNLSFDAKEADIKEFFEPAGEVVKIRFATDPKDDRFRGFCHVELANAKQAEKALRELNGKVMLQREVRIDLANRKAAQREQVKDDSTRGGRSRTLFVGNLSFDAKEADIEEFFRHAGDVVDFRFAMDPTNDKFRGFCHVEFPTAEQAEKAARELNGKVMLQRAVRVDLVKRKPLANREADSQRKQVKDDSTGGGGSKTLFVGNLSFDVKEADIKEFFEPAGKVVKIRLAMDPVDGKFRGFCHVELASAEQAQKALRELNGKVMLERDVRLDLASEKPAGGGQGRGNAQRGPRPEAVFVKGFDAAEGEHEIRSSLMAHFSSCGQIARICIPSGEDGNSKGYAYIYFRDNDSRIKSLDLNGSKFGKGSLKVDATKSKDEKKNSARGRSGSGGGRGRGRGRGGRRGGRGFNNRSG